MEHTNKIEIEDRNYKKRKEIQNWIFLALLAIAVIALIYTTTILIQNKNIIQTDTLSYGMGEHNFSDCMCLDNEEQVWYSNGSGFHTYRYGEMNDIYEESLNKMSEMNLTDIFIFPSEQIAEINKE